MKKYIYIIAINLLFITVCISASASTTIIAMERSSSEHQIIINKKLSIVTPKKKKYKNKHVRKSRARKFGGWY